jgi:hypothetical protein
MRSLPLLVLLLVGCAPKTRPTLPWAFEARATAGEVRVLPVVTVHGPLTLSRETFIGREISWAREHVRRERTVSVYDVPKAIATALPGAVNAQLGRGWRGQFRMSAYPDGTQERVEAALDDRARLDIVLGSVSRVVGAQAALFTWVEELSGRPLSTEGFPGDVVDTELGPVVVDHRDEPYWVTARVGIALVANDGEVVLRYEDTLEGVLSARHPPRDVGRRMADQLAGEIMKVWATEAELAGRHRTY